MPKDKYHNMFGIHCDIRHDGIKEIKDKKNAQGQVIIFHTVLYITTEIYRMFT